MRKTSCLRMLIVAITVSMAVVNSCYADDAVGLYRSVADAYSWELHTMPFVSFTSNSLADSLAGEFSNDDALFFQPISADALSENLMYFNGDWCECGALSPTLSRWSAGDMFLLLPYGTNAIEFVAYGKVPMDNSISSVVEPGVSRVTYGYPQMGFPSASLPSGLSCPESWNIIAPIGERIPWIKSFCVENATSQPIVWNRPRPYPALPVGKPTILDADISVGSGCADLEIDTGNEACTLLVLDSDSGYSASPEWRVLANYPTDCGIVMFHDLDFGGVLSGCVSRFYMIASERDSDDDGVSDALETYVYGTDADCADSDCDGMPDGWEIDHGFDPQDPSDAPYGLSVAEHGLLAEFRRMSGNAVAMPDFASLLPMVVSVSSCVNHPDGEPWRDDGVSPGNNFACRLSGYLRIDCDGDYTFYMRSDDAAALFIDNREIISDVFPHGSHWSSARIELKAGYHDIRIDYYENTGAEILVLEWEGPGFGRTLVPSDVLYHVPDIAPIGYAPGIEVKYYGFQQALSEMPDISQLEADATNIVANIHQPFTTAEWEGAPDGMIDQFAAVFEGALVIPDPGYYSFKISSDDGFIFSIDGTVVTNKNYRHGSSDVAECTVALWSGVHPIRMDYFENNGSAGIDLQWARGGVAYETIPERFFVHPVADTVDSDGDGLPDWWEIKYGLDPESPYDCLLDLDGDGLSNRIEFTIGTNPLLSDTDGDGMPDAWEIENDLCPFIADGLDDPDGDALSNVDEYRSGTNPHLADTDGDGCPDGVEVAVIRGNPTVADIYWTTPILLGDLICADTYRASTGTWRNSDDGSVYAGERAGSLTWQLDVPVNGADALVMEVVQHEMFSKSTEFDLSLNIDGVFISRQTVSAPYGSPSSVYFFLPEVSSGEHEFRLFWNNRESNSFLAVNNLRFVRFGGADLDENGIADWRDNRDANVTGFDDNLCESLTSPLCIEGHDLWRDILEVAVDYPDTNANFSVIKTIGDGFYVDIPLPENGTTSISMVDRALMHCFSVTWADLDVSDGEYTDDPLVVRTGDSLKIAPISEDECQVLVKMADVNGEWVNATNWVERVSTVYEFSEPGAYIVEVSSDNSDTAFARIDVVSSKFPRRNPAVIIGERQTLECPGLAPRNLLEHDPRLNVTAEVANNGGVVLTLDTNADGDLGLVSRLFDDGSISDAVQATPVWADNGEYYRVIQAFSDGSQLIEMSLLFGSFAEDMSVVLEIFVSGVAFEDGTRTKTLTAADFDEDGHYTIRFLRARGVTTSVCHRTYIYQGSRSLYTNRE